MASVAEEWEVGSGSTNIDRFGRNRRQSNRLLTTGLLCATITVGVGAAAVAAPAPAASVPSTVPGTMDLVKLRALQDVEDALANDPDHSAGSFTDGLTKVTINLVGHAAANRPDLAFALQRAKAAGIQAEIRYRRYSLRELTALKDSIPRLEPFASLGRNLLASGVNPESNSVRVSVAAVTPDLVNKVWATFGNKITLEKSGRPVPAAGRFNNRPNYLGGNRLRVGGTNCTGGFTIRNATGHRYALTAGHCYPLGAEVVIQDSNHFFGTVQFRRYNDAARMDMELVGVDVYRGGIWTGGVEGDLPSVPVTSSANSCLGCKVFFDGSVTGQALGTVQTWGNSTDCIYPEPDLAESCHVVKVRGDGGAPICTHGDSGGPVFAYDGRGGAIAVGIITAVELLDDVPNPNVCWYTRIVPILWYWNSTIYTVY